jgi:hypothetical protein
LINPRKGDEKMKCASCKYTAPIDDLSAFIKLEFFACGLSNNKVSIEHHYDNYELYMCVHCGTVMAVKKED